MSLDDLIQHDDPATTELAEDLLRQRGPKPREVTRALRARNFTTAPW